MTPISHVHILSIIQARLEKMPENRSFKILDAGCGNGKLITYLIDKLSPQYKVEFYGFDVVDHGDHSKALFREKINMLDEDYPDFSLDERVMMVTDEDPWPFPDQSFDFITSNQVLEHVRNYPLFFSEARRTLCADGTSINLFPVANSIIEWHIRLPFAHRINNFGFLRWYLRFFSRFGLGFGFEKYENLDQYAEEYADYLLLFTNYLSMGDILQIAKQERLRATFYYTPLFYKIKLIKHSDEQLLKSYRKVEFTLANHLSCHLLKYISSITLVLEKQRSYDKSKLK
jgi:SAM-dependent methyltransferase